MTRAESSALDAALDWQHPLSLDSLLPPRASGWHPLCQAGIYCALDRGDLSEMSKRTKDKRRIHEYVVNKALAHKPLPDPAASERARKMRAGVRWSDSPSAVRPRTERERLAQKRQERGQA